jgi:hypothetical protein
VWTLAPPISLWFEYVFLFGKRRSMMEQFKYEQDAKAKIWLAFVTVLTVLYFGKDLWTHSTNEHKSSPGPAQSEYLSSPHPDLG